MKLMVVVNAIISVGNRVCAAVSSSDTPTSDALKKSIDSLKQLLLPHWAEDTERRAKAAKDMLVKEVTRGPLTVKVLGRDQNKRKRKK